MTNIPKINAMSLYPSNELMKQLCEVIGLLSNIYDVEFREDDVLVDGTAYSKPEFQDRLYYCAAHAIYNRGGIGVKDFFATSNPVFQLDLNNNRWLLEDATTYLEMSSMHVDVHCTDSMGTKFHAALPKGEYHLVVISGHGSFHLIKTEEKNFVQIDSSLPTLDQILAYYSWYRMEAL